ncbi:MAG: hypothetical protein ABIT37_14440, partial [Luteolibacter sp.]
MSKIGLTRRADCYQSPRRCACHPLHSFTLFQVVYFIMSNTAPAATTTVSLGNKTFVLDREKAELAYAGKRVINGKETMFFN